jgi:hypothetical protein
MVHYVNILYKGMLSIALGSVTMASLRNMGQTFFITSTSSTCTRRQEQRQQRQQRQQQQQQKNHHHDTQHNEHNALWKVNYNNNVQSHNDQDMVISHLKQMSRKELLELFLQCKPPNHLDDILGSWDGILLSNNLVLVSYNDNKIYIYHLYSFIFFMAGFLFNSHCYIHDTQTSVSQFITHGLFGKGCKWNGKSFYCNNHNKRKEYIGTNRFQTTTAGGGGGSIGNNHASFDERHPFDYSYSTSRIQPHQTSIVLDYQRYQHFLSPWKTMKDEIRVLRPRPRTTNRSNRRGQRNSGHTQPNSNMEPAILIGLGSMGWSGGKWNCQPFCLVQVLD